MITLAAIGFSGTITLGAIIVAICTGAAALATFGYGVRWKTNYEVEKENARSLGEGREAFKLRAERLEGELGACKEQLVALEATRSLEPVIHAVLAGFKRMEDQVFRHEERAQQRHETNQRQGEAHLRILEMIAERVGPEPNGNGDDHT